MKIIDNGDGTYDCIGVDKNFFEGFDCFLYQVYDKGNDEWGFPFSILRRLVEFRKRMEQVGL